MLWRSCQGQNFLFVNSPSAGSDWWRSKEAATIGFFDSTVARGLAETEARETYASEHENLGRWIGCFWAGGGGQNADRVVHTTPLPLLPYNWVS
jgi:hypothetical protein